MSRSVQSATSLLAGPLSLHGTTGEYRELATRPLFMAKRQLKGRPVLLGSKRSKKIDARFTGEEYNQVLALEKELGVSKTELIRRGVLKNAPVVLVNAKEMLRSLDTIGLELARSGNNINQLARYANILSKRNILSQAVAERFNYLLDSHLAQQKDLTVALRKVIKHLGNG